MKEKRIQKRRFLCPETQASYSYYVERGEWRIYSGIDIRDCARTISLSFDCIPSKGGKSKKATQQLIAERNRAIRKIEVLEKALVEMKKQINIYANEILSEKKEKK